MKLGKNRIHLLIMLFAVLSLLVHVPSDVFANDGGNIVKILESEHSPGDRGTTTHWSKSIQTHMLWRMPVLVVTVTSPRLPFHLMVALLMK